LGVAALDWAAKVIVPVSVCAQSSAVVVLPAVL